MLERELLLLELPILVKKSHFEDAWARDFCRQSLLDTKQQDAKSWLNIIKSRSYSLSRHTMISCYSSRVESDAMRDAFFPQKLQESRDYYLTFVILGKFRTFISHWLEKNNASLNWSLITKWAKRGKYFEILLPKTTKKKNFYNENFLVIFYVAAQTCDCLEIRPIYFGLPRFARLKTREKILLILDPQFPVDRP